MNAASFARARPGELEARVVEAMRAGPVDVVAIAESIGVEPRYVRAVVMRLVDHGKARHRGWTEQLAGQGAKQRMRFDLVGGAA
jgi:hypothetical protein